MALATSVFRPLSLANCYLSSSSTPKATPFSLLSISSKPLNLLPLFSCYSSSSKKLPLWRPSLTASVAQTSDWAPRQDEDEDAGFDWGEQQQQQQQEEEEEVADGAEAGLSEWEGEGGELAESGDEESAGDEEELLGSGDEDSYLPPPEEAKLFVGNLPYNVESADLAALFDQAGVVESAEVIYNRDTDQSRGFGFVVMSTVEEAEKAVEMFHRYDLNGRSLTVNKAAPRGARPERSPQVFEPGFRMYVGNLPWQVDDARLEQVFSEHGKVVDARVVYDRETGRSRGFGFVTMSTKTELDDAIAALDGQNLDGRAIRVNVAEDRPRRGAF